MFKITSIRRKVWFFLAFILTLLFIFQLSFSWINTKQSAKPKLKDWQINGIVAALDDGDLKIQRYTFDQLREYQLKNLNQQQAQKIAKKAINLLKNDLVDSHIRISAAKVLGNLENASLPYIEDIAAILKDEKVDSRIRSVAALVLGNLGDASSAYAQDIAAFLKDEKVDPDIRGVAVYALFNLGDASSPYIQDILSFLKDEKVDSFVRASAAETLGNLGDAASPYIQDILSFLKDEKVDLNVRRDAAQAIGNLGDASLPYIEDILAVVKDDKVDLNIRRDVADALGKITKLNLNQVLLVLNNFYYPKQASKDEWRFRTYFLGGGTEEVKTLLKWLGHNDNRKIPTKLTHHIGKGALEFFAKIWQPSEGLTLRDRLASRIIEVTKAVSWQPQDIFLLETHYNNLKKAGYNKADSIVSIITRLQDWKWLFSLRNIILIHPALWLLLIFAYPKYPKIQRIFFWNPWVRKIFGMGYVGFLLTWIPFLRRRLFEPFRASLLADARLNNFDEQWYFSSSRIVKNYKSKQFLTISSAIPSIKGKTFLIGDSGLGKSMFLRHLANNSVSTTVYLPANKCSKGVIAAIQAKLQAQVKDAKFLKNLIYSGAIDICIDGLNEVTADTRLKIKHFVDNYFWGNIIITTQTLEWEPPAKAKIFCLQPLQSKEIEEFLISRELHNSKNVPLQGLQYQQACKQYLKQVFHNKQSLEELTAIKRVLCNPMDLTLVAQIQEQGKQPDLFRLQQQQYNLMAAEYQQQWGHPFPLRKFSSSVYQMRLNDEKTLNDEEFHQELLSLSDEKYKMVISRQWQTINGETIKKWYFRHDKIMDFFLVQNFLGDGNETKAILKEHIGDPRFRGVYFLLANRLQPDAAFQLRENLIQYAAETNDHTVSDTFVKLLRSRKL